MFDSQTAFSSQHLRLSIIIPVLNEERQIGDLLRTLEPQVAAGQIEIIVVDGGSCDRTPEIVRGLGFVQLVEFGRANRGLQMNAGASRAQGEILLFLHADVRLPQRAVEMIGRIFPEQQAVAGQVLAGQVLAGQVLAGQVLAGQVLAGQVLGGCFQIRFPDDSILSLRIMARGINFRTRLFRTATGDQAIFVRRDVFNALGGYRNIPLMEDVVLFNQIKSLGPVVILDDRVEISPRRWLKYGVWRTMLLMYVLRFGYWIGVSPVTLKRFFVDIR